MPADAAMYGCRRMWVARTMTGMASDPFHTKVDTAAYYTCEFPSSPPPPLRFRKTYAVMIQFPPFCAHLLPFGGAHVAEYGSNCLPAVSLWFRDLLGGDHGCTGSVRGVRDCRREKVAFTQSRAVGYAGKGTIPPAMHTPSCTSPYRAFLARRASRGDGA